MGTGGLLWGLGWLTYVVFSLLPDSSTRMVSFPWVLILQAGWWCGGIACCLKLWQSKHDFLRLGYGLDWALASIGGSILLSTLFSQFPNYGILYGLNTFFLLAGVYGVVNWCQGNDWQKLVYGQAYLSVAVSIESLGLWLVHVLVPQLQFIHQTNQAFGTGLSFDFTDLLNRNGEPFGHPNYTAGYLMLSLPLLVSLAVVGRRRWLWWGGIVLSLITLYTTSSRGGILGLAGWVVAGSIGLWWRGSLRRGWILGGMASAVAGLTVLILLNSRLRNVALALVDGLSTGFADGGGELLYRMVTTVAGWHMGLEHWLTGAGLGSVYLIYQKYRPPWAGTEAEALYQLHSTPVQIWAELGLLGIIACGITIGALVTIFNKLHSLDSWREDKFDRPITYGLCSGLFAYGLVALTDYQLDLPAINGTLVIMVGVLAFIAQKHSQFVVITPLKLRQVVSSLLTLIMVISLWWIIPFQSAWQTANLGFLAIGNTYLDLYENKLESAQTNFQNFNSRLQTAHQQVPWYTYYPYQIAWNLGNLSQLFPQFINPQQLQTESLQWWLKSIELNPNYEFPFTNGGYLSLKLGNYPQAIWLLTKAIKLAPTKRSLHFMLGDAQLKNIIDKRDTDPRSLNQALNNLAQEIIYDPISITHSLWTNDLWSALLKNRIIPLIEQNLQTNPNLSETNKNRLRLSLATLKWWTGDPQASQLLRATQNPTAIAIAEAMENKFTPVDSSDRSIIKLVLSAYYQPAQRLALLTRAYGLSTLKQPDETMGKVLEIMAQSMNQFSNPVDWLRQKFPETSPLLNKYRVGAGKGFNVINRNSDGATPFDFWQYQESSIANLFLRDLFPSVIWKI
jgi:uncharacterized protein involved in response to NO